jgi:hypothetical protein
VTVRAHKLLRTMRVRSTEQEWVRFVSVAVSLIKCRVSRTYNGRDL